MSLEINQIKSESDFAYCGLRGARKWRQGLLRGLLGSLSEKYFCAAPLAGKHCLPKRRTRLESATPVIDRRYRWRS